MKNTIKTVSTVLAVAALLALALAAVPSTKADNLRDFYNPILNYTGGSNYFYAIPGTTGVTNAADTTGYTNTAAVVAVGEGTTLSFLVHVQGAAAAFSNNLTLAIKPAFSAAAGEIATAYSHRIAVVPNGTTAVTVVTNVTSFGAPFAVVTLENPTGSNQTTPTNVVVKVNVKTP